MRAYPSIRKTDGVGAGMAEYIEGNETPAGGRRAGRTARGARDRARVTLVACSPLLLTCTSNPTACPSARVLQPSITHVGEPSLGAVQGAIQLAIAQHGADIAARLRVRHELEELVCIVGPRPCDPAPHLLPPPSVGLPPHPPLPPP